jgi:bifunctional ADP-heptose synthase (sugar kinase/adenylyltransferase)
MVSRYRGAGKTFLASAIAETLSEEIQIAGCCCYGNTAAIVIPKHGQLTVISQT